MRCRKKSGPARVIAAAIVLVAALLLQSGCGGSTGDDSSGETSHVTPAEVKNASGTVQIASYQYYDAPQIDDAGSVKSDWSYAAAEGDLLVTAKHGGIDLMTPSSNIMPAVQALNLLHPIDTSLIPAFKEIPKSLRENPLWKSGDGSTIVIPAAIELGVVAWDSSKVPEPKTYSDLLKPIYRNSIAILDDPEVIASASAAVGVTNSSKMTKTQLAETMEYLEELRPNIRALIGTGEGVPLWNRGEITVEWGGFGIYIEKAIENNPAIKFSFSGQDIFPTGWGMTRTENEAATLKWLNHFYTVPSMKAFAEASGAIPVIPAARPTPQTAKGVIAKRLAQIGFNRLIKEHPIDRGFAVESSDPEIATIEEATRDWNNYRASF